MTELLKLTDFPLQCGVVLPEVCLAYQIYGEFNSRSHPTNVILYPTSYGAQHPDLDWLIAPDSILNSDQYCIVMVNMLGNGISTSPSNSEHCGLAEQNCWFTHWDNLRLQAHLVFNHLEIPQLALVYGWSMGAQQAYHWAACYPDRVERIAALCGTARTTEHNQIFLQSLRHALTSDPTWTGSSFDGVPDRGLQTFARIYASWAASQAFYRDRLYLPLGYSSLEDYLLRGWEAGYRKRDPRNLIAMIDTWLRCDVSDNPLYHGDYLAALAAIQAKTLVMPGTTDLYFTPEDCHAEANLIPNAQYLPIPSLWGHRAGNPYQNPQDAAFIRSAIAELLAD
ncbi:alpha/beta fold hydrolase [Alkalinema pantanalense CENA528]|uniref:alpha/beta fold hydrolase n=1 Tax=Alkalinema pantanalense TaxID=1620705 RepID=UPI003D6E5D0F